MSRAVYVPLLVAVLAALVTPSLTRRLSPRLATWTLTITAMFVATASLASLGLLAWLLVAELPPVAGIGRWQPGAVASASPVPPEIAAAALAGLAWMAWRLARRVAAVVGEARVVLSLERRLPSRHGPARLVVVDDPVPSAYALAGLPHCGGHILVSTGILQALDDTDLRHAVLAHERAHLRHHHATIRVVVDLARAINPLLRGVSRQVAFLLERWADEEAATATSRATAAEALATMALASAPARPHLAFHHLGVPARVAALLDHPTESRPRAVALWVTLGASVIVSAFAILHACLETETFFETIRSWQQLRG